MADPTAPGPTPEPSPSAPTPSATLPSSPPPPPASVSRQEPTASPTVPRKPADEKAALISHVFEATKASELPEDDLLDVRGTLEELSAAPEGAPATPLSAVKPGDLPRSVATPEAAAAAEAAEAEGLPDEPTAEELAAYKPKVRKRIEKLLDQRRQLSAQLSEVGFITDAMTSHKLQKDDVQVVLGLATLLQTGQFEAFLSGVQPYVELAAQYTGRLLPPDLDAEVKVGKITPQLAKELASTRMNGQFREAVVARDTQDRQQAETQQRQQQHGAILRDAVNSWEATTRQGDPDYDRKAPAIRNVIRGLLAEYGTPPTPEYAVEMSREAYRRVNAVAQPAAPRRATLPTPVSNGAIPATRREPRTLMEAALGALERH